jgi:hypothetical protein
MRLLALGLLVGSGAVHVTSALAAIASPTTTVLQVTPTTAGPGQQITFTATVTGMTSPAGTVQFATAPAANPSQFTALGDPVGVSGTGSSLTDSTATLIATMGSGTYIVKATFVGTDPFAFTKSPSNLVNLAVGSAEIHNTATTLSATPSTVVAGEPETLTAHVTTDDGSGIVPKGSVIFWDNDIQLTSATLVGGVATVQVGSFGPGKHLLTATYGGDSFLNGTTPVQITGSTGKATIQGPSLPVETHTAITLEVSPIAIHTGDTVTIRAHVTQTGGALLPLGTPDLVTFSTAGAGFLDEAHLDSNGDAILTTGGWVANPDVPIVVIEASYAGDSFTHILPSQAQAGLLLVPLAVGTRLTLDGDRTADFDDPATLTATLVDTDGNPVSGKTIAFTVGTQPCDAITDGNGVATCHVVVSDVLATNITATFAGDLYALPAQVDAPFRVTPDETTLTASITGGLTTTTLNATLLADGTTPIAQRAIAFTLGGDRSCTAVTDDNGHAQCTVLSLTGETTALLTATFVGDNSYARAPFRSTVTLQIPTTTTVGSGPILSDATVTLTATLLAGTTPVAGRTLHLSVGSLTCDGLTDATGVTTCTVPGTTPLGPATTRAVFDGFELYLPSHATSSAALLYAFAKGGGTFVVGDQSAGPGAAVTFWGSTWAKVNRISGGEAPDAFKGYAASRSTTCGTGWSTGPGKSSAPPDAPLPSYMAVVVASAVTKSGSTIAGTTRHIVIVQTDASSKSKDKFELGKDATGTVVTTVC